MNHTLDRNDIYTRRVALQATGAALTSSALCSSAAAAQDAAPPLAERSWLTMRGIYGGFPTQILERGEKPSDYGFNAIWVGSGGLSSAQINRFHDLGLKVFAEFNSMHSAAYLKEHPDAAPIGPDGKPSPPPNGWQGVSPFHAGYRAERMNEFRRVLSTFEIDGVWLDYHHAHASWEQAEPELPDTDFSPAALRQFTDKTRIALPADSGTASKLLLGEQRNAWTDFRCAVFTDWVREYREIRDAVRPKAVLGTFHCPWSPEDRGGAIREKLAIDLPAQAKHIDVFSIMPYHARFGHASDPAWISRQTASLGRLLGIQGLPSETKRIWPIVQLADWGENVAPEQVATIIDHGTRQPATGVMVFHWGGLSKAWPKVEALKRAYLSLPH